MSDGGEADGRESLSNSLLDEVRFYKKTDARRSITTSLTHATSLQNYADSSTDKVVKRTRPPMVDLQVRKCCLMLLYMR